ncbi:MAG: DUF2059 domain-containing protein [Gammaproteobacteria bacterium]|nr:DUF2059 domain-containing protein [Gammaproteobacteria bacterium]
MRQTIILILLCVYLAPASAEQSPREAAALKLLEASRASEMVEQVYDSMLPQFSAMAEQMGIDEAKQPIFDRHMVRVFEVMREEMNWEKMEPYMVSAYAEVYTEQELLELTEFYGSPLGQKFLAKMPELMSVTMEATQEMMGGFYGRLEGLQAELKADLEAGRTEN